MTERKKSRRTTNKFKHLIYARFDNEQIAAIKQAAETYGSDDAEIVRNATMEGLAAMTSHEIVTKESLKVGYEEAGKVLNPIFDLIMKKIEDRKKVTIMTRYDNKNKKSHIDIDELDIHLSFKK